MASSVASPLMFYGIQRRPFLFWLAPNLITVCGAIPFVIVAVFIAVLCPWVGPAPRWLFIAAALAIVWHVLCDECDGRQARRLGVGSS